MNCRRCGQYNPPEAMRCMNCGAPLSEGDNQSINNKIKKTKGKSDNIIIGSIIGLVLVLAIMIGIYAYQTFAPQRGFEGVGGGGGSVSMPEDEGNKGHFTLEATKHEFVKGTNKNEVYFYAKPNGKATSVELIDGDGNIVAEMKDDGLYSESGDDLQNDNVFTAKMTIDTQQEETYFYYARAGGQKSNEEKISVIALLTNSELAEIRKVDGALSNLRESNTYQNYSIEDRRKAVIEKLKAFEEEGVILANSIYNDQQNNIISFCYNSGVLAVEELEDASPLVNGKEVSFVTTEVEPYTNSSDNIADISEIDVGKAKIMYATADTNNARYTAVRSLRNDWKKRGLKTEIDADVTVSDMKKLGGYNFVCVDAHGAYYTFNYEYNKEYTWYFKKTASDTTIVTAPGVILREKTSTKKDSEYSLALKTGKVIHCNGKYGIVPEFFKSYYDSDDLEGSIFLWTSCEFMGKNNAVQDAWTKALTSRNVAAFVGYHNSVYGWYVYDMLDVIVPNLINGDTIEIAYNKAIKEHGKDDSVWFNKVTENQDDSWYDAFLKLVGLYEEKKAHMPAAYPLLRGDKAATLVDLSLKNGNFEESSNVIKGWKKAGDVRLLTQLGDIVPQEGNLMSILTTGIGSGQSTYLHSTEGSSLYQTFIIPEGKTRLLFKYNIVSEEPTEYIGSEYDDKFYAEILNSEGEVIRTIAKETVNNSEWTMVNGINFDGGDDTVYQTGWVDVEEDISDLSGQIITIRFVVFDVGDSSYDTAAVVDSVLMK